MRQDEDPIYLDWLRHVEEDERRYIAYNEQPKRRFTMPRYNLMLLIGLASVALGLIGYSYDRIPVPAALACLGIGGFFTAGGLFDLWWEDNH